MAEKLEIIISAKDKASGTVRGLTGALGKLDKIGLAGLKIGLGGATAGLAALGVGLKKAIDLADTQQQAERQLNTVLKSTEFAAGLGANALKDLASEMQGLTTFGDEAVIGAENLLLTFTNIKDEIFKETIPTILDLSVAMDQGLKESAIQVGKALNDPIQGIGALQRVGIQFTDAQKEQIKTFIETNQLAKAQGVILEELQRQFGGSAQAAAEGKGKFIQLQNALGDLGEVIGGPVLDILSEMAENAIPNVQFAIERAQEIVPRFGNALKEALGGDTLLALQDFQAGLLALGFDEEQITNITGAVAQIRDSMVELASSSRELGQIISGLGDDASGLDVVLGVITGTIQGVSSVIKDFTELYDDIVKTINAIKTIGNFFSGEASFGDIGKALSQTSIGQNAPINPSTFMNLYGQNNQNQPSSPINNNIIVNPTPVTLNIDSQKVAEAVSKYQGPQLTGLANLGGIGAQ